MREFLLGGESLRRFWEKVSVLGKEDCWEWTASRNKDGYGHFRVPEMRRALMGAHCVSFGIRHGYIPEKGSVVRHTCDNPPCCNPAHLLDGTLSDNAKDAIERGLWRPGGAKGERNRHAKLTEADVMSIRRRLQAGARSSVIAAEYCMSIEMIDRIHSRQSWKHVA